MPHLDPITAGLFLTGLSTFGLGFAAGMLAAGMLAAYRYVTRADSIRQHRRAMDALRVPPPGANRRRRPSLSGHQLRKRETALPWDRR